MSAVLVEDIPSTLPSRKRNEKKESENKRGRGKDNWDRKQESARCSAASARDEVQDLAAAAPAGPRPQHRAAARALLEAAYVRLHII